MLSKSQLIIIFAELVPFSSCPLSLIRRPGVPSVLTWEVLFAQQSHEGISRVCEGKWPWANRTEQQWREQPGRLCITQRGNGLQPQLTLCLPGFSKKGSGPSKKGGGGPCFSVLCHTQNHAYTTLGAIRTELVQCGTPRGMHLWHVERQRVQWT